MPRSPALLADTVREALREVAEPVLRELVSEILAEQQNSNGKRRPGPLAKLPPAIRRCRRCGRVQPALEYGRGRATCRTCRRSDNEASAARRYAARQAVLDESEAALLGLRGARAQEIALGQRRAGVNTGEFTG